VICFAGERSWGAVSRGSALDWSKLSNRLVRVSNLLNGTEARLPAFAALFGEVVLEQGLTVGVSSTVGCAVWSDLEGRGSGLC
jgi:ribosomal protein S12 methylthiotransferase accessory factor